MPDGLTHPDPSPPPRRRRLIAPSWDQRKRALRVQAWVLVAGTYALVAFAHLWPAAFRYTTPAFVWTAWTAFMVRTFEFHLGLALLPVAVVCVWYRNRPLAAAVAPLLLITLGPAVWSLRPRPTPAVAGETITVMSVNLLAVNRTTAPIIEEIKAASPDVLLLQEYTWTWHKAIQQALGEVYPHIEYTARSDSFGTAIYSRRRFENTPDLSIPLGQATEPQLRAVIRLTNRPIAFYNLHLLPPFGLDYTVEHRSQFADLLATLESETLPVVMGGDFNFTENSPHASSLRRLGIRDAHDIGGWGRGATWPVNGFFRWIPSLRLDHIYLGGGLTCTGCRTGVGHGSDHRPVIARVGFAG